MSDRYDLLLPPDLISTIKSMPRRWSAALYLASTASDDAFTRPGDDGLSAAQHAGAMLAQVDVLAAAIRSTSFKRDEVLGPDVLVAIADEGSGPEAGSIDVALKAIDAAMDELAAKLESLSTSDWNTDARTVDGTVTLVSLVQGAARVTVERLRKTELAIGGSQD